MMRWVALVAVAVGFAGYFAGSPRETNAQNPQNPQGKTRHVVIVDPSDWNGIVTRPNGSQQKISVRLRYGVIYPAINNIPSGKFAVDAEKRLHIEFNGHPVIPVGEALLEKQVAGHWVGFVNEPNGQSRIEIRRVEERRR